MELAPLHLLSDFDGVWTEPTRELQAVHDTVIGELARLAGCDRAAMEDAYAGFAEQVLRQPEQHGWRIDGKLSSYVDEDVFAMPTAVGQWLDAAPGADERRLRARILDEWPAVIDFLDDCYHGTCSRFRETHPHDLTRGAERVLRWLLDQGVTICFATNAPAEKVIDWFAHYRIEVADARHTSREECRLRVFGRAGKQWLGESGATVEVGGRAVQVDRPQYRAILEQERPDAVVGDVFSLDLALPAWLRREGLAGAPQAIGLMHLRHTPDWVRAALGGGPDGWVDWLVPHVTALPRLLAGVPAAPRKPRPAPLR